MKISYFVFALVITTTMACKTVKTTNESVPESSCPSIVIDKEGIFNSSDEFLLVGAEMKGKCLEIEVEYSGGCGGDIWTLAWDGSLMKSLPPKANVYLHLKDNDDCRQLVRKKVSFDVSSIYNNLEVVIFLKNFRGELRYKP